jgi:guanylate kinase
VRNLIICTLHRILLGHLNQEVQMGRACSTQGKMRNAYKIFVRKPDMNRPLRRLRNRWEDNIRRNLREIGWEDVD